ncbi:COMM domain-containing protein 5 [Trichoplax sp. H2]|nr:COMM domain-containing protein 5 [Trichoplax sp. H2]|eukprot:RDD38930.1 COMM domain-containing protein 5 [Trichoplax sp. H2]
MASKVSHGTKPGNRPGAIERTLFAGYKVPDEVSKMSKLLKKIDHSSYRKIVVAVVKDIEGDTSSYHRVLKEVKSEELPIDNFNIIFAGTKLLIASSIRLPDASLKSEVFETDLQQMRIPDEVIPYLRDAVYGSRRKYMESEILNSTCHFPRCQSLRWRVDVTISTSTISRSLVPNLLLELTLSNGKIFTFEVSVAKFHELRYNIAKVLKEMNSVENKNILKIQD